MSGAPSPKLDSEVFRKVAHANLRLATDEQIKASLGLRRDAAKSVLEKALKAIVTGRRLKAREATALEYFGNRFIWNPAFTDLRLFDELVEVLTLNMALHPEEVTAFRHIQTFNTLFAITQMYGSTIVTSDGSRAELIAGYGNKEQKLEVRALLILSESPKPVLAPVCVFWTTLDAEAHCSRVLMENSLKWSDPLDVKDGELLDVL